MDILKCKNCGYELFPTDKICGRCGTEVPPAPQIQASLEKKNKQTLQNNPISINFDIKRVLIILSCCIGGIAIIGGIVFGVIKIKDKIDKYKNAATTAVVQPITDIQPEKQEAENSVLKEAENEEKVPDDSDEEKTSKTSRFSSLDEIITKIEEDTESTIDKIKVEYDNVIKSTGDSYYDYKDNYSTITDWYDFIDEESTRLFSDINSYCEDYYKMTYETCKDFDSKNEAMDNLYDKVYSGALGRVYDEIYSGALNSIYDDYYSGFLDKAYSEVEYSEWSEATTEFYSNWSDALSSFYKIWSDELSTFYTIWSTMYGGMYDNKFTFQHLMKEAKQELEKKANEDSERNSDYETVSDSKEDKDNEESKNTKAKDTKSSNVSDDEMRPEFKEAMDSYEAFYDEYCEFMKKYQEDVTNIELINQYAVMMKKIVDMDKKFEEWESDNLTTAETKYYVDVNARIQKKMLDIMK